METEQDRTDRAQRQESPWGLVLETRHKKLLPSRRKQVLFHFELIGTTAQAPPVAGVHAVVGVLDSAVDVAGAEVVLAEVPWVEVAGGAVAGGAVGKRVSKPNETCRNSQRTLIGRSG